MAHLDFGKWNELLKIWDQFLDFLYKTFIKEIEGNIKYNIWKPIFNHFYYVEYDDTIARTS